MLKKYLVFLSFALLVLTTTSVFAQGGGQGPPAPGGGGPIDNGTPPANPIDGGLGLLLVVGIGYGVKKLRKED